MMAKDEILCIADIVDSLIQEGNTLVRLWRPPFVPGLTRVFNLLDGNGESLAFREFGTGKAGWQWTLRDVAPVSPPDDEIYELDLTDPDIKFRAICLDGEGGSCF